LSTDTKILGRLDDVSILRCFAVLSLVIWHSYCPIMFRDCWPTVISGEYEWVFTRIIPDANMPLFTFLAGFLFCYQLDSGKYQDFKEFFMNKFHRLFIPFLVLGLVINLLEYGKNITDMLYGGPNHLWYCLMLFYCYVLCWVVEKKCGRWVNYVLMCASFCVAFYYGSCWRLWHTSIPGGWEFLAFYYGYFYLGYLVFKHRDQLFNDWKRLFIYLLVYVLFCAVQIPYFSVIPLRSISYVLLLFAIVYFIFGKWGRRFVESKPVTMLDKYSFGIFVFHQWIIWNVYHIPESKLFMRGVVATHFVIVPIVFVIIVLFLSIVLTHYSLKTKVGRYLLL